MHDTDPVHVADALHDLFEEVLGVRLRELSSLAHVVQKVATRAQFHHDQVMFLSLERLQQFDVTYMLQTLQNVDLLLHLFLHALLFDLVLVRGLDGHEFPSKAVQSEVDFTERALAQDPADFVQLDPSLGHHVVLSEAVLDHFGQEANLAGPRTLVTLIDAHQLLVNVFEFLIFVLLLDHEWTRRHWLNHVRNVLELSDPHGKVVLTVHGCPMFVMLLNDGIRERDLIK